MLFKIKFNIFEGLDEDWIRCIKQAIKLIKQGAPGLMLEWQMGNKPELFYGANSIYVTRITECQAYTYGNIFTEDITTISLSNSWDWHRQGTALHEIMHALGFHHEHSRKDRDRFVKVKDQVDNNYSIINFSQELTPFDPFSVMLYSESEDMERTEDSRIWRLKKDFEQPNNLSELDKVSLNILYPPVITEGEYDPKLGRTGLYYCGRPVMKGHNHPDDDIGEGVCGPDSGPNCPACRTLKTDKMDKLNATGKVQGYSGMIYGGKEGEIKSEGHDGRCGPDNGPPCDECLTHIFDANEIENYIKKLKKAQKSETIGGTIF